MKNKFVNFWYHGFGSVALGESEARAKNKQICREDEENERQREIV